MQKILFITNSFGMGGAEKVLLDIVKAQKKKYGIHVLAFEDIGPLKEGMHDNCKVISLFNSGLHYLVFRKIKVYRKYLINKIVHNNKYDVVVGFMEGKSTDLVADIDVNVCKIGWVHSDFRKLDIGVNEREMYNMYSAMDKIVCVSNDAKKAFLEKFSILKADFHVIYNLIDEKTIKLSTKETVSNNCFTFLNVGMLRKEKCQDRLIRIAAKLKKQKYNFQIQIIGDGPLMSYLSNLIEKLMLSDKVVLLGMKQNPYPYIKACDCFVLSSNYEGYGIVVKEALFLKKLILTTDVVGPREILEDGRFGVIVDNNEDALFHKMKEILDSKSDYPEILDNLDHYQGDNDLIKKQLSRLFDPTFHYA